MTVSPALAAPLSGALETVALADVLQLLDLGRKSGVLAVDAGDGRRGLVRLVDGAVSAARYQSAHDGRTTDDRLDAVAELLALAVGRFAFTPGAPANGAAPHAPGIRVEALLMAAFHRADEQARVTAAPDAVPVPTLAVDAPDATDPPSPALSLRALHWAVLAAVDGARDTVAVAELCGRDRATVDAALGDLARAGLVCFADPPARPAEAPARVASAPAHSSVA